MGRPAAYADCPIPDGGADVCPAKAVTWSRQSASEKTPPSTKSLVAKGRPLNFVREGNVLPGPRLEDRQDKLDVILVELEGHGLVLLAGSLVFTVT